MANAEIYKTVDPVTGEVSYSNQRTPGAKRLVADRQKAKKDARYVLNKLYPGSCERICTIEPGMPIHFVIVALDLRSDGYSHTDAGKIEHWRNGSCKVFSREGEVIGVYC